MKKVLLTGATGFIGRHVLEALSSDSIYEVHAIRFNAPPIPRKSTFWHQADILDSERTDKLLREVRPDFLMHLAWYTAHGEFWDSDNNLLWEEASINLIKKFYECGGRRIVAAGTCAEYSWNKHILSEDESPLVPASLYGQCKLRVCSFLNKYSETVGKSSAWGRIFFVYGPYENPRRLVPSAICSLLRNKRFLCLRGEQLRDFLYVKDAASAFVSLMRSDTRGAVNIASGKATAIRDILTVIGNKLDKNNLIRFKKSPPSTNEPDALSAKVERLTHEAGWQADYDMDTGITHTIRYWEENIKHQPVI